MSKAKATASPLPEIEDVSGGHVFAERARWASRGGADATTVARRGARNLEHVPTQVMPPPQKLPKLLVGKVSRASARDARAKEARPHIVSVDSQFDIEPPEAATSATSVTDDDDRDTEIWARPKTAPDSAWASAPTRSMAAVWRDAGSALQTTPGTQTAPAPTTDASLTIPQPHPLTAKAKARTRFRGRARGRAGALVCALAIWLADAPLVDDSLAWGARAAAHSERAANEALTHLESMAGRARWLVTVALRTRESGR